MTTVLQFQSFSYPESASPCSHIENDTPNRCFCFKSALEDFFFFFFFNGLCSVSSTACQYSFLHSSRHHPMKSITVHSPQNSVLARHLQFFVLWKNFLLQVSHCEHTVMFSSLWINKMFNLLRFLWGNCLGIRKLLMFIFHCK